MTFAAEKTFTLEGIRIPDTRLAREITQFVRDNESGLLFHHSSRVYYWGALAEKRSITNFSMQAVVHAHPRSDQFKEDIIQSFYDGIKHKPDTTFGNVKADVLADKDPAFRRGNFCSVIRGSAWRG